MSTEPTAAGEVRPEYPRPRLVRSRWHNLNGTWAFRTDPHDRGLHSQWMQPWTDDHPTASIVVPFAPQSPLSGVHTDTDDDLEIIWYQRLIDRPSDAAERDDVLLHIGACDHRTQVWIDGTLVGTHEGGHLPFALTVGDLLSGTEHVLTVRAEDRLGTVDVPRGKQHWVNSSDGIFYTPTTGIWQTVWLEPVPRNRITDIQIGTDVGSATATIDVEVHGDTAGATIAAAIALDGREITHLSSDIAPPGTPTTLRAQLGRRNTPVTGDQLIDGGGAALWSPEHPSLYDVTVKLISSDGTIIDALDTYFGVRSVEIHDGQWCLNGRPYEQRMVLDQGYWPDGLMTAPTDQHLRRDIELTKELGFNGVRKHQKIEDPRYLYWADRLGLLVWSEVPSGYAFSPRLVQSTTQTLIGMIERDRSHPSIVTWVPVNESWGVPDLKRDPQQRALLDCLYHLAHALDDNRPVVSNDGWEHASTDIVSVHDYGSADAIAADHHDAPDTRWNAGRPQFIGDGRYTGQPQLLTEFGGITLQRSDTAWGYATVADGDDLLRSFAELLGSVRNTGTFQGYCYTQLTDVETETNGVLNADRTPKCDMAKWRSINEGTGISRA